MNSISMAKYEQEYKEMQMILRGIAHEMGNALTVMGYSIKSFGKKVDIVDNENWNYLNEDFDYICKLFRNLSAYNHSRELQIEKMYMDKMLKGVVEAFADEYMDNGIKIRYTGDENLRILGDEVKLRQVFINIIKNAYESFVEECEKDKEILVFTTENKETIKVHIKDNGCGIKEENMEKLFIPMYTENKEGGTGLGLFVCKNIIESHGGNIAVKSVKGKGSEFIVELKK